MIQLKVWQYLMINLYVYICHKVLLQYFSIKTIYEVSKYRVKWWNTPFRKIIMNLSANQGDGGSCCCRTSIKLVLKHSYCCVFVFTIDCINYTIKVDKFLLRKRLKLQINRCKHEVSIAINLL